MGCLADGPLSKEKSSQLAVNDEVITPDPEDEIIDFIVFVETSFTSRII